MAHLLLVLQALVRQHVQDQQPTARAQHAARFIQHAARVRDVVQHQDHQGGIERPVGQGKRLQLALAQIHVAQCAQALGRGLQHLRGAVHRDHLADERREGLGHQPGPTAEVARRSSRHPAGRAGPAGGSSRRTARSRSRSHRSAAEAKNSLARRPAAGQDASTRRSSWAAARLPAICSSTRAQRPRASVASSPARHAVEPARCRPGAK